MLKTFLFAALFLATSAYSKSVSCNSEYLKKNFSDSKDADAKWVALPKDYSFSKEIKNDEVQFYANKEKDTWSAEKGMFYYLTKLTKDKTLSIQIFYDEEHNMVSAGSAKTDKLRTTFITDGRGGLPFSFYFKHLDTEQKVKQSVYGIAVTCEIVE